MASCMADGTMASEYPDNAQRYAVCLAQWEENREGKAHPRV